MVMPPFPPLGDDDAWTHACALSDRHDRGCAAGPGERWPAVRGNHADVALRSAWPGAAHCGSPQRHAGTCTLCSAACCNPVRLHVHNNHDRSSGAWSICGVKGAIKTITLFHTLSCRVGRTARWGSMTAPTRVMTYDLPHGPARWLCMFRARHSASRVLSCSGSCPVARRSDCPCRTSNLPARHHRQYIRRRTRATPASRQLPWRRHGRRTHHTNFSCAPRATTMLGNVCQCYDVK